VCWPLDAKDAGSKPGQGDGFLRVIKNPQHTFLSDGKILRHVKELLKSHRDE
jgi:hypothetical protein